MLKAWVENNNIFLSEDETIAPSDAIEVPDGTQISDLKIENGQIVLKTQQEKEQEQIIIEKENLLREIFELSNKFLSKYPEAESKGWQNKVEECKDIISTNSIDQNLHSIIYSEIEALYGSIPTDFQIVIDYCNSILEKEQSFKIFSGKIAGLRKRIENSNDLNELQNIIPQLLTDLKDRYGL
ncbi:MAG: hypothetical protein KatS3mg068_1525 [Candidatus Sericytochromatia bacterium]|nr:MAG: hypothetical protein KatS3mg068_1525 [Candidatus Sericytochromatia bacterium]